MKYEKVNGIMVYTTKDEAFDSVVDELQNIKTMMDYHRIHVATDSTTGEVIDYHDITTALRVCQFISEGVKVITTD